MKILIDIGHPAHVHFFKEAIHQFLANHYEVTITSRLKEIATDLLDELKLPHIQLTKQKTGIIGLLFELLERDIKLFKVVRKHKPDVMMSIGGIFIAQVGAVARIPSLVFYDTENATLQNALTYPFATRVIVPDCYQGWVPKSKEIRYAGYHELAYLAPDIFTPDRSIAEKNGLNNAGAQAFFLRLVSWEANHDVGEEGWNVQFLIDLVAWLSKKGQVIISSESSLPTRLSEYAYRGKVSDVHHVMAFCSLFIGESATMCSESVVLGVPGIYIANTSRGYVDEQTDKYKMSRKIERFDVDLVKDTISDVLTIEKNEWACRHQALLSDMLDVPEFIVAQAQQYAPNTFS